MHALITAREKNTRFKWRNFSFFDSKKGENSGDELVFGEIQNGTVTLCAPLSKILEISADLPTTMVC